jgi:hypothetical protein
MNIEYLPVPTSASRLPQTCRSTSVIPAVPGSAVQTRTPTDCCVSTSREEPTSRASPRATSTASPCGSINVRERPWASKRQPINYERRCTDRLNSQTNSGSRRDPAHSITGHFANRVPSRGKGGGRSRFETRISCLQPKTSIPAQNRTRAFHQFRIRGMRPAALRCLLRSPMNRVAARVSSQHKINRERKRGQINAPVGSRRTCCRCHRRARK